MTDWDWLAQVDPNTVERERFNVDARVVKRTEGTHLGFVTPKVSRDERLRLARREADLAEVVRRGSDARRTRDLERENSRLRRELESASSWKQKLAGRAA